MINALGLLEVDGMVAAIDAADAMLKAANVRLLSHEVLDPGRLTLVVEGDLAATARSQGFKHKNGLNGIYSKRKQLLIKYYPLKPQASAVRHLQHARAHLGGAGCWHKRCCWPRSLPTPSGTRSQFRPVARPAA